jgi:hypothetical protein
MALGFPADVSSIGIDASQSATLADRVPGKGLVAVDGVTEQPGVHQGQQLRVHLLAQNPLFENCKLLQYILVLGAVSGESGIIDDPHQRLFDREVKFHGLPCPRYQRLYRIPVRSALDRFLEFRDELQQGFVLIVDFLYAEGILVFPHHFSTSLPATQERENRGNGDRDQFGFVQHEV